MAEKKVWIEGGTVEAVPGPMQYIGQGEQRIWIEGGNIAVVGGGGGGDLTNAGVWNNATAYTVGDVVTHNKSSYVAIADNTGQTPPRNNGGTQASLLEWTPLIAENAETTNLELGCKFQVDQACDVTAVNWYRGGANNAGPWDVSVWNADTGANLNTTAQGAVSASGWQTQTLSAPVPVVPGTNYIASYSDPGGRYSNTAMFFQGGHYQYGVLRIQSSMFATQNNIPNTLFNDTLYFVSPTVTVPTNSFWLQLSKGY